MHDDIPDHSIHGPYDDDNSAVHVPIVLKANEGIFAKFDASCFERWYFRYLRPLAGDSAVSASTDFSIACDSDSSRSG